MHDFFLNLGSCQLTVLKLHPEICQIRLDFEQFALAGKSIANAHVEEIENGYWSHSFLPSLLFTRVDAINSIGPDITNHICNSDQFLVSGGSTTPVVCGISHGDHSKVKMFIGNLIVFVKFSSSHAVYIEAGLGQSNPIILTAITSGAKFPRSWRIRVSQIHCGSIFKADQGCLQYFTGVSGRVRSFNFDPASGRQLSNQDYSICIRMERNFCSIQYNACPDPSGSTNRSRSFTLSGNSNVQVTSMIGGGVTSQVNACPNDWLMIPCAKVAGIYRVFLFFCVKQIFREATLKKNFVCFFLFVIKLLISCQQFFLHSLFFWRHYSRIFNVL